MFAVSKCESTHQRLNHRGRTVRQTNLVLPQTGAVTLILFWGTKLLQHYSFQQWWAFNASSDQFSMYPMTKTILGGSCHKYHFIVTKVFSRQTRVCCNTSFVVTKVCLSCLSQQKYIVVTKLLLWQIIVVTNIFLSRQKMWSVVTNTRLLRQTPQNFGATKTILVAAPTDDKRQAVSVCSTQFHS